MIIDEKNFIGQIKDQNEDALKYIIDKYGGLVKSVVSKTLYAYPQDIEESVLDTFMKVWQNIKYFDESKNTFKNWIAALNIYTHTLQKRYLKIWENALFYLSLGLKTSEASRPNSNAAVIPPAALLIPPVKIPSKPFSSTASRTPSARR